MRVRGIGFQTAVELLEPYANARTAGSATGAGIQPRRQHRLTPEEGLGRLSVATREEAFRTLLRVSDCFRRTEPHSPISHALEQAVRWVRMSLPELLSELVSDKSTRDGIFRSAGISEEARRLMGLSRIRQDQTGRASSVSAR